MRGAVVLGVALTVACAHQSERRMEVTESTDTKKHVEEHAAVDTARDTHTERDEGAHRIDSVTAAEQLGVVVEVPDAGVWVARVPDSGSLHLPAGARVTGTVPLGRTSEASTETAGPVHESADVHESGYRVEEVVGDVVAASNKHATGNSSSSTRIGPPWWVWALVGAGAAIVIAVVAWLRWPR